MLPTGDERTVLKALQALGVADAEKIASKAVLSPGYVEEVCQSLIEKDFVRQNNQGVYRLTPKGETFNLSKYVVTPRRASIFRDW